MAWSGVWNDDRTVFTGSFTAPDGTVFTGTWTPPRGSPSSGPSDPPTPSPLSNYDPYAGPGRIGPRVDDGDSTRRPG